MKQISIILISVLLLVGCKKDYNVKIKGVGFKPALLYNGRSVIVDSLNNDLIFLADFYLDPPYVDHGYRVDDYIMVNTVKENTFAIYCDHDIYLENDTVVKKGNLMKYFDYLSYEQHFYLGYAFKNNVPFYNENGIYKFFFETELSDKTKLIDSCIVKVRFNR